MIAPDDSSLQNDIKNMASHHKKMLEAKKDWDIQKYNDARKNFSDVFDRLTENRRLIDQMEDDWVVHQMIVG